MLAPPILRGPKPAAGLLLESMTRVIPPVVLLQTDPATGARLVQAILHGEPDLRVDTEALPAALDWRVALRMAAARHPGACVVLLRAELVLPPHWLQRLLQAAQYCQGPVAALSNRDAALSPACADDSLTVADPVLLDAACFGLAQRRSYPVEAADPPLLALAPGADPAGDLSVIDHLYVHDPARPVQGQPWPADPRERAPEHPLAELRQRLREAWPQWRWRAWPGLDGKPVVLHLLHGWGGGAEVYVRHFAAADRDRHHLLLCARGHPGRFKHGEWLELGPAEGGPPLRRIALAPAIGTLVDVHPHYAQCLQQAIAHCGVGTLVVNSLIGHSLEALRCGLPMVYVAHDYFPFWPVLHCDFGDPARRFDQAELAAELARAPTAMFSERDASVWWRLREASIAALRAARPVLVTPTASVAQNLRRLLPEWPELAPHVIAHGIPAWPDDAPSVLPAADERLRLVIVGRLNEGKGLRMLEPCLPALTEHAELYLIGPGKAAEALFGRAGIHIQLDYERHELPARLAGVRPHAALLLSTVAESFSYTLSEIWSLGIPPIATRLGAFAERIQPGHDGLLVEPEPQALLQLVAQLAADRSLLTQIRATLAGRPPRTLAAMLADYQAIWPAASSGHRPAPAAADAALLLRAQYSDRLADAELALTRARERLREQQEDLERRAEWAFGLDRQLAERTRWAQSLARDLEQVQQAHRDADARATQLDAALRQEQLAHQHDVRELLRIADEKQEEIDSLMAQWTELVREHEARQLALRAELAAIEAERDAARAAQARDAGVAEEWRTQAERMQAEVQRLHQLYLGVERERDAERAQIRLIQASWSWKLTAPLRIANRMLARWRTPLAYRWQRLLSQLGRLRGSLARRGLAGTLARIRREFAATPGPAPQALSTSAPVLPSADYDPGSLSLPASDTPLVSVIVPIYNQLHHTWNCLRALRDHAGPLPIEVIVVDDGCSDASPTVLPQIAGLRYHRNPQNLGFIGACNAGAGLARGRYLFFLNNDAAVQPGWLEPLLATYQEFEHVGLVGSKLIYPDGRLQEAGGIVFNDASGWNYGRFDHPDDPRYDYPREADYCSGAAILIEKALFDRFGGFDAHYKPAYYEDTDLGFKVRAAGLRVIYQPASRVVHYEGVTSGTDISTGTKRFQAINQLKFRERWAETLAQQPAPTDHAGIWKAATHRAQGRILLIDATTPEPDQDSGSVRYVNLVRALRAMNWRITFFADNRAYVPRYSEGLRALGVEVLFHPWLSDPVAFFCERGHEFDAVMVSRHYIASHYVELVRQYAPQAQLIFDTVDLHYLREQRAAEVERSESLRKQAEATRAAELDLIRRCDVTVVVSQVEHELLAREAPGARVEILSNIHQVAGRRQDYAARSGYWFVGGFQHQPNVDAMRWFVAEIWPRVHAELPEAVFHIVGSKMPPEIAALARPGIEVHGYVESLDRFLDECRLSVAPLRYGAGVKGKVNQSMAHGQPVVATPIAVEGMAIQHEVEALVAETPEAFAAAIVRLYRDESLWQMLSTHGIANIERHFSLDAAQAALRKLLAVDSAARRP